MAAFDARSLIQRKRDGGELLAREINGLIRCHFAGQVSDAQMAAFLMAVCLRGMTLAETTALTLAMAASGRQLDLSSIPGAKVDKHSTGGVGDKTTLVVAPLVAAAGLPVVKLSGRALGHTGGTIDKLETIPGLRTDLVPAEMLRQVRRIGVAIAAQSVDLAPADKRLYALRDATGTVESIPLIAASVMSKKLAVGAGAIVLDVKVGRGAFVESEPEARRLAQMMVGIGKRADRKVVALLTRMDQPLGRAVGDALEVREAVETLRGRGPEDLLLLCLALSSEMLLLGGKARTRREAAAILRDLISSGKALEKFRQLVAAQGGDSRAIEAPDRLLAGAKRSVLRASRAGYLAEIEARAIGEFVHELARRSDGSRDHAAGILLSAKQGDHVTVRQPLAEVYHRAQKLTPELRARLRGAFVITRHPPRQEKLILGRIR